MSCALARHCFINEYVFDVSDDESRLAGALRDEVTAALQSDGSIVPLKLAAAPAYFPLHSLPGAETLLQRAWPEPVQAVLIQQVAEPLQERQIEASIPALTAIGDDV